MRLHIPCIKEKCILLPICKNKQEISCSKLVDYITFISIISRSSSNYIFLTNSQYKKLFKLFNKLVTINTDNRKISFLFDLDCFIKVPSDNYKTDFSIKSLIDFLKRKRKENNNDNNKNSL